MFFCSSLYRSNPQNGGRRPPRSAKRDVFRVIFTGNSIILFSFFFDFFVFTTNAIKVTFFCVCLWKIQNNYRFCFGICGIYAIFEFFGFCKSVLFWENEKVYFFDVFFLGGLPEIRILRNCGNLKFGIGNLELGIGNLQQK